MSLGAADSLVTAIYVAFGLLLVYAVFREQVRRAEGGLLRYGRTVTFATAGIVALLGLDVAFWAPSDIAKAVGFVVAFGAIASGVRFSLVADNAERDREGRALVDRLVNKALLLEARKGRVAEITARVDVAASTLKRFAKEGRNKIGYAKAVAELYGDEPAVDIFGGPEFEACRKAKGLRSDIQAIIDVVAPYVTVSQDELFYLLNYPSGFDSIDTQVELLEGLAKNLRRTVGNDDQSPLEKFEAFVKEILTVTKDDIAKTEEAAKEIGRDALGPPPAVAPAIEPEE
jgi:hypothetical protein